MDAVRSWSFFRVCTVAVSGIVWLLKEGMELAFANEPFCDGRIELIG